METINREKMIEKLTAFCHARPIDGCSTCPIRRKLAQGFGCVKIKDRTDEQLAADLMLLPQEKPVETKIEVIPSPYQPSIKYMVTVDRDMLRLIRGELLMLSRCVGATITKAISDELAEIAEAIRCEIEACDQEAAEAERAMHEALQREREALMKKEEERNV